MNSITAAELAARLNRADHEVDEATAQAFLDDWLNRGIVSETSPGRYCLTDKGWSFTSGLVGVEREAA